LYEKVSKEIKKKKDNAKKARGMEADRQERK